MKLNIFIVDVTKEISQNLFSKCTECEGTAHPLNNLFKCRQHSGNFYCIIKEISIRQDRLPFLIRKHFGRLFLRSKTI